MKLIWVMIGLMIGSAAQADSLAAQYFDKCTGSSLSHMAEADFRMLSCQATNTCQGTASDREEFAVAGCYETALNVCLVAGDISACVRTISGRLDTRTASLLSSVSPERIENAIEIGGLRGRSLAATQEKIADIPIKLCNDESAAVLLAHGVPQDIACGSFQSLIGHATAAQIVRQVNVIERQSE